MINGLEVMAMVSAFYFVYIFICYVDYACFGLVAMPWLL